MSKKDLDSWVDEVQGFIDENSNSNYKLYDTELISYDDISLSLGINDLDENDIHICRNMSNILTKNYVVKEIMHNNSNVENLTKDHPKLVIVRF